MSSTGLAYAVAPSGRVRCRSAGRLRQFLGQLRRIEYRTVGGTAGFARQGPAGDRTDLAGYSGSHLPRRGHLLSAERRRGQRRLFRTGPVAGETFEQKVARLKALSAAAKQRAEEGGEAPSAAEVTEVLTSLAPDQEIAAPAAAAAPPAPAASAPAHKPTGNADRTLFKRSTYCGVVDTGPVAGETFQQKIARLTALSAAAKQRSEGG